MSHKLATDNADRGAHHKAVRHYCVTYRLVATRAELTGCDFFLSRFTLGIAPDAQWSGIVAWNNAPERTAAEVAARLREEAFKE